MLIQKLNSDNFLQVFQLELSMDSEINQEEEMHKQGSLFLSERLLEVFPSGQ